MVRNYGEYFLGLPHMKFGLNNIMMCQDFLLLIQNLVWLCVALRFRFVTRFSLARDYRIGLPSGSLPRFSQNTFPPPATFHHELCHYWQ